MLSISEHKHLLLLQEESSTRRDSLHLFCSSASSAATKTRMSNKHRSFSFFVLISSLAVAALATRNMPLFVDLLKEMANAVGTGTGIYLPSIPTSALQPCLKGSMNCIRTTWVSGTSKKKAIEAVQKCLVAYPQEGQNGIDKGGWKIEEGNLQSGSARLEFQSGIGPDSFAKYLNGGKPYIDDLLIEVQEDGRVEVRSSSRIGFGDMGVNQKRLHHLASALPKTWDVSVPEDK